jgi:hypothetical protein
MAVSFGPFREALAAFSPSGSTASRGACVLPELLDRRYPHLDPDFGRLTYGDNGLRRGRALCDLVAGDLLVFFAGLRPVSPCPHRLIYAIIGLYRVAEVVLLKDVPRDRWAENAHTRKLRQGPNDVIVRGRPGVSGRLMRALPIGEYRDRAYRVRRDLLRVWGGLSCNDGYIQRSAVPPAIREPHRFLRWFAAQGSVIVAANNPTEVPTT